MEKLKEFWAYYIKNMTLRNITAVLLDIINILLVSYCVYISWIFSKEDMPWWIFITSAVAIIILSRISIRLTVTNICPECLENRGLFSNESPTGNIQNYQEFVKGDYWHYSQEVEYKILTQCGFCEYLAESFYWKKQEWQGDLTEEAKARRLAEEQRRLAEEQRKAQTQAIVDAYAEINRRNRGY